MCGRRARLSLVSTSCMMLVELRALSGPVSSSLKQRKEWYFFGGPHCEPSTWKAKSGVLPLVQASLGYIVSSRKTSGTQNKQDPVSQAQIDEQARVTFPRGHGR